MALASMKLRTLNGKDRHLSTTGATRVLEEHGVETPDGPHASLGFRPPAPEVVLPAFAWPVALRRAASPTPQTVAPRPMLH